MMKKKILIVSVILTLFSAGYAITAFISTRGLKIYRMGTTMGKILTRSYQPAAFAAFVLLVVSVILVLSLKKKTAPEETVLLEPDHGTVRLKPTVEDSILEPTKGTAASVPGQPQKAQAKPSADGSLFCMKCGKKRSGNERFCTECGNPF